MSGKKQKKKGKPHKKKQSKPSTSFNPIAAVKNWFGERQPVVKFLLGFVACMFLFYLFYYSSLYRNYVAPPLLHTQANISNALLNLFGYSTSVSDTIIRGDGFAVNIKSGCDGLEAMAILISGILIFPTSLKLKVPGILWGIAILVVLNLLRTAGLYVAGLHFSESIFNFLHIQGGFIIFTMISVILWFVWMNWSLKQIQSKATA